jgi:glutathione synthase/RimK-type ligase-like ATP-grasp enzyme
MAEHPWKIEEEQRFLDDPRQTLGDSAWAAIEAIGSRMDLDYAGVDFTLLPDGRVLLFEANPVMLVHPEEADGVLAFKNVAVSRILDAFEALLARTTQLVHP